MFNVDNLSSLSGVEVQDVRTFLPSVLNAIRDYTNRSFITCVGISGDITISDGKIKVATDIPQEMIPESQIELRYSINNTNIYTIKSVNKEEKTIETYEKLFDEEFNGFIIRLSFEGVNEDVISSMINFKKTTVKYSAVKSESLGGFTYTLNVDASNSTNGYPNNLMSSLTSIRQLPESREVEYYERGFTKIPFCRYSRT